MAEAFPPFMRGSQMLPDGEMYAEFTPAARGRLNVIFLAIFAPVFIGSFHWLASHGFPLLLPIIYLHTVPLLSWVLWHSIKLLRTTESLIWKIEDGRAVYVSPAEMFGPSFDLPLSDIRQVRNDGDTEFAVITADTSKTYRFFSGEIGGRIFLRCLELRLKA